MLVRAKWCEWCGCKLWVGKRRIRWDMPVSCPLLLTPQPGCAECQLRVHLRRCAVIRFDDARSWHSMAPLRPPRPFVITSPPTWSLLTLKDFHVVCHGGLWRYIALSPAWFSIEPKQYRAPSYNVIMNCIHYKLTPPQI